MYADREEAALINGRKNRRLEYSSSNVDSSASLSPSNKRRSSSPPGRRRDARARESAGAEDRERQLQEQLRRRAMMSKNRSKRSSRSSSRSASRSPSRSPSPDSSYRSRRKATSPRYSRNVNGNGNGKGSGRVGDSPSRNGYDDNGSPRDSSRARERMRRRRGYDVEADEDRRSSRRSNYSASRAGDSEKEDMDDEYDARSRRRSHRSDVPNDPYARREAADPYYDRYYYGRDAYSYDYYRGGPPSSRHYDPYARDPYYDRRRHSRSPSPPPRRGGASGRSHAREESRPRTPDPDDYELRSIFCSQLAARLGQRDLGEFFEDKLGENTVRDVRIITDRVTGRSKGIGYVELSDEALVEQALALSGSSLFGIPILIQKTEATRNRTESSGTNNLDGSARPNLDGGVSASDSTGASRAQNSSNSEARLYVGSLNFNLNEEDVRAVFAPFGDIENVDLHREPGSMKSKGFAFIQFTTREGAEKAMQHMNGFDLAGRQIRVGRVNAKGPSSASAGSGAANTTAASSAASAINDSSGSAAQNITSFDEGGGGGLSASGRVALMEKLARNTETGVASLPQRPAEQLRPASIPQAVSRAVLLKHMFNPEEETERDWDTELAADVKEECQAKYGPVEKIFVDKDSSGDIWLRFADLDGASKGVAGLNGRFFGGQSITAEYVSEGIMNSVTG